MAILLEHGTKAKNEAVWNCSFFEESILVALVAGAVQPRPKAKGIKAFPGRPISLVSLSALIINLASSPVSSINPKSR